MSASACFLLITTCFFVVNSFENTFNNGWRPTSNEKVAELQNFIKKPRNNPSRVHPVMYQKRVIQTPSKEIENYDYNYDDSEYENNKYFKALYGDSLTNQNTVEDDRNSKLIQVGVRRPKKIEDTQAKTNTVKEGIDKNGRKIGDKAKNNYEVTETLNEIESKLNDEVETKTGYFYLKPKTESEKNNFTKNLFSILGNYNIRSNDKLQNYASSLRQNSRPSNQGYAYMQIPIKVPLGHNSPNHIPISSLLAVFLSNYGVYLPGLYGFTRNYNNLYGYLASNNIHNNKPFGSYKVVSDTDSYH